MTTSDLDPDALADWANEKAVGIVRCWLDSSGTLAAAIATALREAEKRGQEAMRERAARVADRGAAIVDTLAPLSMDDDEAAKIVMKSRDNMKHVASRIASRIRGLTAREPGVTGKGEG